MDDEELLEFAARLKARRQALGLTMAQVSRRLGRTDSYYSTYEGATRRPTVSVVTLLAEALETTPQMLLGWEEPDEERARGGSSSSPDSGDTGNAKPADED